MYAVEERCRKLIMKLCGLLLSGMTLDCVFYVSMFSLLVSQLRDVFDYSMKRGISLDYYTVFP